MKVEHIGIAVKNLKDANTLFERLLGAAPYKTEGVETEGVITSFFKCGETKIELLEATTDDSAIKKFIEKKGEGIHHVAFEVDDIFEEVKRLRSAGFNVLHEPKRGADNKLITFLHPKTAGGVLVEICQEIK